VQFLVHGQLIDNYKNLHPFPNLLGNIDPGFSFFPIVDNLKLHIRCYTNKHMPRYGELLIFDSGLPMFSTAYGNVIQNLLSNNTMNRFGISNACFFDRYGYGWSQLSPEAMSAQTFVKKLRASIQSISLIANQQFYYVGWSMGGLFAQTYAMMYPNDLKGILSIDGTDIGVLTDKKWIAIPDIIDFVNRAKKFPNEQLKDLCRSGTISIEYGWISDDTHLPKSCIEKSQAIFTNPDQNYLNAVIQELTKFIDNAKDLKKAYANAKNPSQPLGNLPLVVISSNPDTEPDWFKRQINLTKLSSNSIQLNCNNHLVPFNQPNLIINAIEILIAKAKFKT
ncbi:hypothetical protein DICPUDRAFT_159094, partial [Dictyostelium purpureum]